jgi:endonuclease YncB( thermonuclease family)
MEAVARRERLGLWADAHLIPPWEWRKSVEKGAAAIHMPGPVSD